MSDEEKLYIANSKDILSLLVEENIAFMYPRWIIGNQVKFRSPRGTPIDDPAILMQKDIEKEQ